MGKSCFGGEFNTTAATTFLSALWVRFQTICMSRTKARIKRKREEEARAREIAADLGSVKNARLIYYTGKVRSHVTS